MKALLKNRSFAAFTAPDRLGIHVLPKQSYAPVADHRWLRPNR